MGIILAKGEKACNDTDLPLFYVPDSIGPYVKCRVKAKFLIDQGFFFIDARFSRLS